jgi:filamentous hemagglutinin
VAKVGTTGQGNLNIESLQDISTYKSNQSSRGFSASAGPGNYGGSISASNSNIKSNLAGAVIASTDQAIQNNKNSITTQTLTTSDLANKAEYSANASSVTIGLGTQGGLPQLSGVGMGSDEGKVNTATVSAISHGIVSITDSTAQQESTGTDAVTMRCPRL